MLKRLLGWVKDSFVEVLNQTFTLLGFFTAWVLLEGSARTIVGGAILWSLIVWLLSINIRDKE